AGNSKSHAGVVCQALVTSQPSVRRLDRARSSESLPTSFKHHKRSVLICEPTECRQRNRTIRTNYNQPFQSVAHTREAAKPSICADPVRNDEMTTVYADINAVTKQRYDALQRNDFGEIAVLKRLRYGRTSCHRR